jgi:hypothetical protein
MIDAPPMIAIVLCLLLAQARPPATAAERKATALVESAIAAHNRGNDADARWYLTRALTEQPSMTAASLLLGEILYSQADLQGAINAYEQALAHAPADERLKTRLDAWRKEAAVQDNFSSRMAAHFTILFEGPADRPLATRLSEMLEAAYWRVGGEIGAYPPDVLTVILYSKEQFRDVTQSPSWAGGLYDGRIRIPVGGKIDEAALRRIVAHELTHAVVHALAPRRVPLWLNEGLAVLMEQGTPPAPPDSAPPLKALEGSFAKLSPADARAAYATSAAATQALIDRGGPTAVLTLLTGLGRGLNFDEAFERAALMPYAEFQRSWR